MKFVAISFNIQGQDFAGVKPHLERIAQEYGPEVTLLHGCMLAEQAAQTSATPDEVLETINSLFPMQESFAGNREGLVTRAKETDATAFVLGSVDSGFLGKEVGFFISSGVHTHAIDINFPPEANESKTRYIALVFDVDCSGDFSPELDHLDWISEENQDATLLPWVAFVKETNLSQTTEEINEILSELFPNQKHEKTDLGTFVERMKETKANVFILGHSQSTYFRETVEFFRKVGSSHIIEVGTQYPPSRAGKSTIL